VSGTSRISTPFVFAQLHAHKLTEYLQILDHIGSLPAVLVSIIHHYPFNYCNPRLLDPTPTPCAVSCACLIIVKHDRTLWYGRTNVLAHVHSFSEKCCPCTDQLLAARHV